MLDPVPSAQAEPRASWLLAAVALAAVLALGNLPLVTGHASPMWDAADLFEPVFATVGDATRSGHLLKWDPWSGAGTPDWAQPEFGTTSPVLLAFSALPVNPLHAYIAYWLSVWFFGGLGMLLLAKHFGCSPSAAAIVACGFTASGFFTGHAEHMSSVYSVAYLPWVLWRFDASLKRGDWRCGISAGALYGLSALGGYPEFTILTPGFLGLWAAARVLAVSSRDRAKAAIAACGSWAAVIVIGGAVLAPPYVGLLMRTRGYTDYIGPRPRDVAISSNLLPAGALSTLASPALALLNRPPHAAWPETDISMTSVYIGAATVVLGLLALRRRRFRWYVAGIAGFFLCCALGSHLPVRGWLYDLAPPTRYFRNPSLFRAYVLLLAGVLAALGARDLVRADAALRIRLWRISAGASIVAAAVCVFVVKNAGKPLADPRPALAHFCAAWFGIAMLSFLLKSGRITVDRFFLLAAVLACLDAMGSFYLSRTTIWDSQSPWLQIANSAHRTEWSLPGLDRALTPADSLGPPINNRSLLPKQAVFDDYTSHQIFRNRFQTEILLDPVLNRMATGSARIWFSPAPRWSAPDQANFQEFEASVRTQGPGLVLHLPATMRELGRLSALPSGAPKEPQSSSRPAQISDTIYRPDSLSFHYQAPTAGFLLVTDRWADGWEASVNGKARPVLGADFIYRAVAVEAGPNSIRFDYRPAGFWPALALSWGTLSLAILWQLRSLRRRRSRVSTMEAGL